MKLKKVTTDNLSWYLFGILRYLIPLQTGTYAQRTETNPAILIPATVPKSIVFETDLTGAVSGHIAFLNAFEAVRHLCPARR